jgi:hypothetical protein
MDSLAQQFGISSQAFYSLYNTYGDSDIKDQLNLDDTTKYVQIDWNQFIQGGIGMVDLKEKFDQHTMMVDT